jgi:hypothetical protein
MYDERRVIDIDVIFEQLIDTCRHCELVMTVEYFVTSQKSRAAYRPPPLTKGDWGRPARLVFE